MAVRVSHEFVEVAETSTPKARVSHDFVEIAETATPKARVSHVFVEVAFKAEVKGISGIPTSIAFGADGVLTATVGAPGTDTGIPSSGAYGADGAVYEIGAIGDAGDTGVPSSLAFGADGIVRPDGVTGTVGIPSSLAFGAGGLLTGEIGLAGDTGVPSSLAFGADGALTPAIVGTVGIPSSLAFGDTGILYGDTANTLPYRFYIDGVDRSAFYSPGSLRIENPKAAIATAEFTLEGINESGTVRKVYRAQMTDLIPPTTFDVSPWVTWRSVEVFKNFIPQKRGTNYQINTNTEIEFLGGSEPATGDVIEIFYFDPRDVVFAPVLGAPVLIYSYPFVWNADERIMEPDTTLPMRRIYAGTIEDIDEESLQGTKHLRYQIGCTDYTQRISKRQFTYNFPGGTLTDLLTVMQRLIFDEEGITWVDPFDTGLVFPAKEYDALCDDVLNESGNATGLDWKIDFFGNFRMSNNPIFPVAFEYGTLTDDDDKTRVVRSKRTRAKYRNTQGVRRTGQDRTNTADETFTVGGGGDPTGTYNVRLFMSEKPNVTVNGTQQVVDSFPPTLANWDCYYKPSDSLVQFRAGHFPPALATVVISVKSNLGNTDYFTDSGEVAARAAIEGGSGKYERVSSFGGFEGVNTTDLSDGLMARYGTLDIQGIIETDRFGILPGQTITLNFENPDYVGSFFIESVSTVDEGGTLLRHSVRVSSVGKKGNGWGDTLGGGIGNGGGWGGGGGEWGGPWDGGSNINQFTETGGINVYTASAPQQYNFPVAASVPGCTNPGMETTGPVSIPRIVSFPGVIREVQAYCGVNGGDQDIIFDVLVNGVSLFSPANTPTFPPHVGTDYTITVFDKFTPVAVRRGDIIVVELTQNGASGAIPTPTAEEMGSDAMVTVVVY